MTTEAGDVVFLSRGISRTLHDTYNRRLCSCTRFYVDHLVKDVPRPYAVIRCKACGTSMVLAIRDLESERVTVPGYIEEVEGVA